MSRCLELARTLASLTFAAVTASVATPAAAIVFNSSFDPVDFFGNATFDVAPSCLGSSGFVSNNGDPCTVTWLTADVTLTNGSNSVSFSYQPEHLPDPFAVQNIFVDDGALVGVNSNPIGPAIVDGSGDSELDGAWWIEYSFSDDFGIDGALDGDFGFGIVLLYHGTCQITDLTRICVRDSSPTAIAQVLNFTRVPEPGTLALLLGAIGVMGAVQRKRNRA